MANTRDEENPEDPLSYYGHPKQYATKCGHVIHPSAPRHTPLCPICIISRTKWSMNAATKGLVAEGGPSPPDYFRDQRWQRAKLRYEIVKKRQATVRSRDQLRDEREQAWEAAHQRFDSSRFQAAAPYQHPAECPVCASMMGRFPTPTKIEESLIVKERAWWESDGSSGTVHGGIKVRTPLRPVQPAQQHVQVTNGPSVLRPMVRHFRKEMADLDARRRSWETRYRTESAVRRKHSLGEGYHFEPEFWDEPVSASLSRRAYQDARDHQRMAERRARGNAARPRPPRSSLSYSEHTDEVLIDSDLLAEMAKKEEMEMLQRQARRVGEEVGYLYFVGEIDGLHTWREDFLRSDRQLIFQKKDPRLESRELQSEPEEDQDGYEKGEGEVDDDDDSCDEMDLDGF
ncbi:hypothetical protein BKA63DRAFT_536594 [Paraphoma chrysanthemicola]|nr:hypothetical protein BKA63DRAFT_536594 [Paraphoma chrysanthemicola]